MSYFEGMLLVVLNRFGSDRSLSAAFHLLKGKKSSQTIQDAKLFRIGFLFGMLKGLERDQFDRVVLRLEKSGLLKRNYQGSVILTSKGNTELRGFLESNPFPDSLNGWKYHHLTEQFWQRLSLFMQSLSCSVYETMSFYPVSKEESTQVWVKKHFPISKDARKRTAEQLYHEIFSILEPLPEHHAKLFIQRLSGSERTGLTLKQAAAIYSITVEEATIQFNGTLHAFLSTIQNNKENYPLLSSFAANEYAEIPLTSSTRQTLELIQRGLDIDQIANSRRLKRSTIEDHLVEIAMNVEGFSIDLFVSKKAQQDILSASSETNSQRLKTIKEHLKESYSYFQIRLTLCKEGI
ncbi:helix-turn-helix domain-containing protein [Pseudalkalibacillus hwajinpoensis]|uniref:helix-turn-helix domain-containing protein n=1 Tax=Guptibacillus hwajinpoensis TaxID=208199 RepID=UPI00325BC0BF